MSSQDARKSVGAEIRGQKPLRSRTAARVYEAQVIEVPPAVVTPTVEVSEVDDAKRGFLKLAGIVGLGVVASQLLPGKADAYVLGGTPTSNVVGVKNASNTRINPATDETLQQAVTGQGVSKMTVTLSSSGVVRTPASGKAVRVYATRFSLTADATSVSFRFTAGGTDHEIYLAPVAGGLYGSNNHPNYIQGGTDQALYCVISGTTSIQVNIDYIEV